MEGIRTESMIWNVDLHQDCLWEIGFFVLFFFLVKQLVLMSYLRLHVYLMIGPRYLNISNFLYLTSEPFKDCAVAVLLACLVIVPLPVCLWTDHCWI